MEMTQQKERHDQSILASNLSTAANVLLAVIKTLVGVLGHSQALLAEGINSTSDVAYSVVVSVFMRKANQPPDENHPYGHRQFESVGAVVVGAFVMTTAFAVFWNAVSDLFDLLSGTREVTETSALALVIALATVAVKFGLMVFTGRVGEETQNAAVIALAQDHRNDIFSAGAAAAGILLAQAGQPWGDPLGGAVVALVILKTGIEILRESSSDLMDTLPGHVLHDRMESLMQDVPGVDQVEEVRAHRFGPYLVANVTIGVDGALSVAEGDEIATAVEHILIENVEMLSTVRVHYHPSQ